MSLLTNPTKPKNLSAIKKNPSETKDINLPKWFVFYTYPKSERKVEAMLQEQGYETYLPCKTLIKQWHDRKKKNRVPLFPNYIFVRTLIGKIHYINELNLISSFVKFRNS